MTDYIKEIMTLEEELKIVSFHRYTEKFLKMQSIEELQRISGMLYHLLQGVRR